MPVERRVLSVSQFAELMGIDPARFILVENRVEEPGTRKTQRAVVLVMEPEMQTTGTCPPLSNNTGTKKKGGKKR
jgi:hypothetical protein